MDCYYQYIFRSYCKSFAYASRGIARQLVFDKQKGFDGFGFAHNARFSHSNSLLYSSSVAAYLVNWMVSIRDKLVCYLVCFEIHKGLKFMLGEHIGDMHRRIMSKPFVEQDRIKMSR